MGTNVEDLISEEKFEEAIAVITKEYQKQNVQLAYLKQMNEQIQTELYKDNELQKLLKRNEELEGMLCRAFVITEEEGSLIQEWTEKHLREKHWDSELNMSIQNGAIGGGFSYEFLPTTIGTLGVIKCVCGEQFCFKELS